MRMSTETETIKKRQTEILELKNTITELKTSLEGFYRIHNQTEEKQSELRDRSFDIVESEE